MDIVVRAVAIYAVVLLFVRISGRRTVAQLTTFDLVLLMVVAEATQQALLGDNFSITNGALVVVTLFGLDIALSLVKRRFGWFTRATDGQPLLIMNEGELLRDRMRRARVDEDDIMQSARQSQGIHQLADIRFAVLEKDGQISIIPR